MAASYNHGCLRNFSEVRGVRFWTPHDVIADRVCAFNQVYPAPGTKDQTHPNTRTQDKVDHDTFVPVNSAGDSHKLQNDPYDPSMFDAEGRLI